MITSRQTTFGHIELLSAVKKVKGLILEANLACLSSLPQKILHLQFILNIMVTTALAMKHAYHVPKNRIMATETARKKYRKAKNAAIYARRSLQKRLL